MREIISLHFGQAGVQTGADSWELFCKEHGIDADGSQAKSFNREGLMVDAAPTAPSSGYNSPTRGSENAGAPCSTFFQESSCGRFVPRALMVDLDPSVIDAVKSGPHQKLFNPDFLLSGKEDAANNFARGYFTVGKDMMEEIMEKVRKTIDQCECLQGFVLFHAVGGGTGSGLCSLITEQLHQDYAKRSKFHFSTWPSPRMATAVVEPYNAIMATHALLEYSDVSVMLDNEAIYDICRRNLGIDRPQYKNLNRLVSQVISSLTASLRFNGALNMDINEFQTNLVPFPRLHFMLSSYAPIMSASKAGHETLSVVEITSQAFEPMSMMAKCDPRAGRYMACCLMYRGDCAPNEVTQAISYMRNKSQVKFVDWCPTGFKTGINGQPPATIEGSGLAPVHRACAMICNSTSLQTVFERITNKFDVMFTKRAFVHWYVGEGMEEGEMIEARENVANLQQDYRGVQNEE